MNRCKMFLAVGAMLTAVFVVGTATPASANPEGTTFDWTASNFQGDALFEPIPFGVATLSGSGMVIDSHATPVPGGDEFLDFWFSTEDGGFLAGNLLGESEWFVTGLNWGPGAKPAVGVGLLYISFDSDGVFVDLANPNNLGFPILPHPITGQDSIVLDVDGEPASIIPFDVNLTLGFILNNVLADPSGLTGVNSMHVGFQVTHIPEPASMMLVMTGLAGLCVVRRRRKR